MYTLDFYTQDGVHIPDFRVSHPTIPIPIPRVGDYVEKTWMTFPVVKVRVAYIGSGREEAFTGYTAYIHLDVNR